MIIQRCERETIFNSTFDICIWSHFYNIFRDPICSDIKFSAYLISFVAFSDYCWGWFPCWLFSILTNYLHCYLIGESMHELKLYMRIDKMRHGYGKIKRLRAKFQQSRISILLAILFLCFLALNEGFIILSIKVN